MFGYAPWHREEPKREAPRERLYIDVPQASVRHDEEADDEDRGSVTIQIIGNEDDE